jgi:hypothetical protein
MQDLADNDNDIAENIAEIRRIIGQRGWCRGSLVDVRGQVCIMGARAVAMGMIRPSRGKPVAERDLEFDPTLRFLALRARVGSVAAFNDRAHDHAAIMEFLIEAQLAAMNYVPGSAAASSQPPYPFTDPRPSDHEPFTAEPF